MKKFKICDNATFAFKHTFENLKEFIKVKKSICNMMIASIVIVLCAAIVLGRPVYNNAVEFAIQRAELQEESWSSMGEGLKVSQEGLAEYENKKESIEQKKDTLRAEFFSNVKSQVPSISIIVCLCIMSSIIMLILGFEWLRFCFKAPFSPSLWRNIWFMIKIFFIKLGYMFIPVVAMMVINVGLFFVNPIIGALAIFLWIPFSLYLFAITPAIRLRYSQMIIGREETPIIPLMKKCKGNIFNYLMTAFLIGAAISIVNWGVGLLLSIPGAFIPEGIMVIISALASFAVYILGSVISFTFYYSFYRGVLEEDERFLAE